ncbi:MAG: polysaccharide biosynthesis C-terminal domain-containing protein [Flavobacteriales bacterium]|nr:polysaccharide biosynthesis C-terminal domain-containing protein [Flavobacteriales bacterium]
MGIVVRQASIAASFSYIGVIIGFINVTFLMSRWFTTEEFGLRSVLIDVSLICTQFAQLGTYRSLVKFFPFFNKQGKNDNGLFTIGVLISLLGFTIVSLVILLFQSQIVEFYSTKSPMFVEYFWAIFPLAFLLLYNNVLESYLQARTSTIFSAFLKDVFNRILTTILLVLYYYNVIDFYQFIQLFIFSYVINILLFLVHLKIRGELSLSINPKMFTRRIRKVYINYSLFSILSGISGVLITKVDTIMVMTYLGLSATGVYAFSAYLSVLVFIPAIAISKISLPILSKNWKEKRMDKIEELYKKTSVNQFLIGGGILILIWCSIDNLFALQPEEYSKGKYVLLLLGLSRVVNMLFGVNGPIINISKYYRFDTINLTILAIFTIIANSVLIPIWGIEGAAFATLLSLTLFNISRFLFVLIKMKIQPFSVNTVKVTFILSFSLIINSFLPQIENVFIDTAYRSLIIMISMIIPTIALGVSEDINRLYKIVLKKVLP